MSLGVRLLREATRTAGPPILTAIVGVSAEIFDSAQKTSQNREAFQALAGRVSELVRAVTERVDALADEHAENVPEELLTFLDDLGYKLLLINEFVQSRLKQGRLKSFVFQDRDASALQQYQAEIQNALDVFKAQSYIAVIQEQDALKGRDGDELGVFRLLDLHAKEVEEYARKSQLPHKPAEAKPTGISLPKVPARPVFLFGRDSEMQSIRDLLVNAAEDGARVAILGGPGIGKTSLALAAVHEPSVAERFGDRRVFIACDPAEDAEALLPVIASALGIKASSSAVLRKDVLKWLGSSPATLLILDNFETPWDAPSSRGVAEDLLTALSTVAGLSLLITLRGAERPSGPAWTRPFPPPLAPLPMDAAHHTFSSISDIDEDAALPELLAVAEGLPLALRLLGSMAAYESCASLLTRWHELQTSLLSTGKDRLSNLEMSISLSLHSARMTLVPHAEELLSLLSLLPDGIRAEDISQTCSIPNATRCIVVLLRTALVYRRPDDDRIRVLAPIRAYMLYNQPPPASSLTALHRRYVAAAEASESYPDMEPENLDLISNELGNAESVLRYALSHAPDASTINAVVKLSLLQQLTHLGSPNLIDAGLTAARAIETKELEVDCLISVAAVAWGKRADQRVDSLLDEAIEIAKTVGYIKGRVRAMGLVFQRHQRDKVDHTLLLRLARDAKDANLLVSTLIALGTGYERKTQLADAKACFAEAAQICRDMEKPDPSQLAVSIGELGDILVVEGRVAEALPLFKEGAEIAQRSKRKIDEANCQRQIGTTYMTLWEPRLAIKYLSISLELYRAGGWSQLEVAALVHIAWLQAMVGDLVAAAHTLDLATTCIGKLDFTWKWGNSTLAFARGDVSLYREDYEDAIALYQVALTTYKDLSLRDYEAEVLKRLGHLAHVRGLTEDAERYFLVSAALNRKTQEYVNIVIALSRLADVWLADDDQVSSINLTYAVAPSLVRLGSKKELADIQLRFAYIAHARQQYDRARDIASKALQEYQRIEWSYGAERCRALLDR